MKPTFIIIFLIITNTLFAQTFDVYKGDTINKVDANNLKQGVWVIFDNAGTQKLEEGTYVNNQKHGMWSTFYPNGKTKHAITYTKGSPRGKATFYYEDGSLWEEGIWEIDHWKGQYKFYYKNGQLAYDWFYNQEGKRTGTQKYYHENGVTKYEGEWINGKTVGNLKIYNDKGKLVTERVYNENGRLAQNIHYETEKSDENERTKFSGTGNHTVYNTLQKIEWKGFFVKGKLFNGTHYIYDDNGKHIKTEVYENGKVTRTTTPNTL